MLCFETDETFPESTLLCAQVGTIPRHMNRPLDIVPVATSAIQPHTVRNSGPNKLNFDEKNCYYWNFWEKEVSNVVSHDGVSPTSTAEKTKTQGQNSSKKLKEKTQPLGAALLKFVQTREKNLPFSQISRGTPKYTILLPNIFKKGNILEIVLFF